MKTTKQIKMIGGTLAITLLFAVSPFQACGPGTLMSGSSDQSSFAEGEDGNLVPTNATKTVNVTHSEGVLTALTAITGATPSGDTMNAYNEHRTKITETGKADSVNAPMWVAITNLSGETCRDLVNKEKPLASAARLYFKNVDFGKAPVNISDADLEAVIRRFARGAWARNETAEELTMLKGAIRKDFAGTAGGESDRAMLFTCTAMLASLDTHDQ